MLWFQNALINTLEVFDFFFSLVLECRKLLVKTCESMGVIWGRLERFVYMIVTIYHIPDFTLVLFLWF